jgi:hypothetical protein
MGKDYEHKQQSKCGGRDYEEIGGDEIPDVIRQERTPGLRRLVSVWKTPRKGLTRFFRSDCPSGAGNSVKEPTTRTRYSW